MTNKNSQLRASKDFVQLYLFNFVLGTAFVTGVFSTQTIAAEAAGEAESLQAKRNELLEIFQSAVRVKPLSGAVSNEVYNAIQRLPRAPLNTVGNAIGLYLPGEPESFVQWWAPWWEKRKSEFTASGSPAEDLRIAKIVQRIDDYVKVLDSQLGLSDAQLMKNALMVSQGESRAELLGFLELEWDTDSVLLNDVMKWWKLNKGKYGIAAEFKAGKDATNVATPKMTVTEAPKALPEKRQVENREDFPDECRRDIDVILGKTPPPNRFFKGGNPFNGFSAPFDKRMIEPMDKVRKKFPRSNASADALRVWIRNEQRIHTDWVRETSEDDVKYLRGYAMLVLLDMDPQVVTTNDLKLILDKVTGLEREAKMDVAKRLRQLEPTKAKAVADGLLPLLKDGDENVLRDTCMTLGLIGNSNSIQHIEPLLMDSRKSVRRDAEDAISKLKRQSN